MKGLRERCKKQAALLISSTSFNKYDFKPSSIIDFNLASLIFPGGEDHGLPTPSSNKTQPPGSCILRIFFKGDQQYLESEEMQNPMPDKLTFNGNSKITIFYVQYCRTVTDHKEQLTDRTLRKSKLMWKSENCLPLFLILSMVSFRILAFKISNDTQPPGCWNVHQQCMETEEMRNPMPDKLTLRSKGKITRLYIQYCHTIIDRKEQLTDRTLHKNKLN